MVEIEKWFDDTKKILSEFELQLVDKYDIDDFNLYYVVNAFFNITNNADPICDIRTNTIQVQYSDKDIEDFKKYFLSLVEELNIDQKDISDVLDLIYEVHKPFYDYPGVKHKLNTVNTKDKNIPKIRIRNDELSDYYRVPYKLYLQIKDDLLN
ncbi:hypothetical protein [Metaclostridioides mangenotii]|uniref:hypothetical protein n=1 Tax=Metaclostridioides mangenotii TaxID=1540 RepID=UPI0026F215E5|nr:hypothetical protein [Clostridioides mangenotii]